MALALSLLLLLALLIAGMVRHVPAGQVYSLHRHGKLARLLPQGTHLVLPLLDKVARKITLDGQTLHFDEPQAGKLYWQVLDPAQAESLLGQVEARLRQGVRQGLASVPDQAAAAQAVKQALNQELRPHGILVTRVEIDPV